MANRVVNSGIEFAYASENIEIEFKRELEKYFIYQNVLVIDSQYNFGILFDKLEHTTKCQFTRKRNIDQIDSFENVDCVIAVDFYEIDKIKAICKKYSIPYIVALTKVVEVSIFKNTFYNSKNEIEQCNYPLGIMFDLKSVYNYKKFAINTILEISNISFDITQKKLNNFFFNKQIDYDFLTDEKNLLKDLKQLLQKRRDNILEISNKFANLYLSYAILQARDENNMLDNLMFLYKKQNTRFIVEAKYAFRLIITSLEKNFFEYYTKNFKTQINYRLHQEYLKNINIIPNFKTIILPETKINFLLDEFRQKLLEYVKLNMSFDNEIKNIIAEIEVDFLYEMFYKFKHSTLTNYICLEPDVFNFPNFLHVLYQLGLLNFEF